MKAVLQISLIFSLCVLYSCNNVARAPLDKNPSLGVRAGFLGIWKECRDTASKDYILVQQRTDLLAELKGLIKADSLKKDWNGVAIYRKALDEAKAQYKREGAHYYFLTEMKKGEGTGYQQAPAFLSLVNRQLFFNVIDSSNRDDAGRAIPDSTRYHFVKVINNNRDTISISVFGSDSLIYFKNSTDVRAYVARNVNNPQCYGDTVKLYKVSNYHENIWESRKKAN